MTRRPPLADAAIRYLRGGEDLDHRTGVLAEQGVALLMSSAWASDLDEKERGELRAAAEPYLTASLRSLALAHELSAGLAAADVPHVVIKGPAIGDRWHELFGVDARTFTDLDLLIRPQDLRKAKELCRAIHLTESVKSTAQAAYFARSGAALDLHWMPLNDPDLCRRLHLETADLFDAEVVWNGLVGRLSPEMTLLHTVAHATISDLSKLSAIVDVHAVATAPELDWDRVVRLSRKHQTRLILATALLRIGPWLPVPVPVDVMRQLSTSKAWLSIARAVARRDPSAYLASGWSGGEFFRHTRENGWRSFASLANGVGVNVRVQRQLHPRRGDAS